MDTKHSLKTELTYSDAITITAEEKSLLTSFRMLSEQDQERMVRTLGQITKSTTSTGGTLH